MKCRIMFPAKNITMLSSTDLAKSVVEIKMISFTRS